MSGTRKLSLISTAFAVACVLAAGVSVNAQQSIVNSTKSNVKDYRVAPGSEVLVVNLHKASGEKVAFRQLADADNDGKLSDAESVFGFEPVPAGDYVLSFSWGTSNGRSLGDLQGQVSGLKSDLTARFTVTGAVGGTIEKEWGSETAKAADATSPSQRLGGLSSDFGQFKIPFKTDGKMSIAGKITLLDGGIVIKNIRKPN